MEDHVTWGTREDRFHARLWAVGGGTVLAVHEEYLGNGNRHVVVSWNAARDRLYTDLMGAGYTRLSPSGIVAVENLRGVPGDGRIWRAVAG